MCGIVGVAGHVSTKLEEVFKDLLNVDVIRGPHSTGLVTVNPGQQVSTAKEVMLPPDFLQTRAARKALSVRNVLIMGHNRYATIGDINKANAHPFEHGHVTGMHNGTLKGWKQSLKDAQEFDVDSDCLLYNLSIQGLHEFTKDTEGAFALSWYNSKEHRLYLARNPDRPLYIAYSEDRRTLLYASEAWMIRSCSGRRGVKIGQINEIPEWTQYSWDLPSDLNSGVGKPNVRKLPEYEAPQYDFYGSGYKQGGAANAAPFPATGGRVNSNVATLPPSVNGKREGTAKLANKVGRRVIFLPEEFTPFANSGKGDDAVRFGALTGMSDETEDYICRLYCDEDRAQELLAFDGDIFASVTGFVTSRINFRKHSHDGFLTLKPESVRFCRNVTRVKLPDEDTEIEDDPVLGPDGTPIDEPEFNELTKHGCALCSGNLEYGKDDVYWEDKDTPLCDTCWFDMNHEEVKTKAVH